MKTRASTGSDCGREAWCWWVRDILVLSKASCFPAALGCTPSHLSKPHASLSFPRSQAFPARV